MKKILVPNGNYTDIPLIQELKKLGYFVITSGNNPELHGHRYADEYVNEDYSDYEKMLMIAKRKNIDAIGANSNDFGVITASYIAENMGLRGHDTFQNAKILHEKDNFKTFAKEFGVMSPVSNGFSSEETAIQWVLNIEYPIIIKPVDLTGGKGVNRADFHKEAIDGIKYAFAASKVKRIVIEPFIVGSQHSITTFLVDQRVVADYSCNEFSVHNPYLVEYTTAPADHYDEIRDILVREIERIATILHLVDGIFHVQYRLSNGKPYIIEAMRRCLGNLFLFQASHMTSLNWNEWIAKSYIGMDCSLIPRSKMKNYESEYYIKGYKNGKIKRVIVSNDVKKYIYNVVMIWTEGMIITNYEVEMLGFVFMEFNSKDERDIVTHQFEKYINIEYFDE